MATYTISPRIMKAYKHCRGMYMGSGLVEIVPKRIKINAFWSKRFAKHKMHIFLQVVK
jgi:hypothetical protein